MTLVKRLVSTATAAMMLLAAAAFGGGFYLTLGNPEASQEARGLHAVLTVMPTGCHDPAAAKVTATAEGVVKGQRRSIPLQLHPLKTPGLYAVTGQWPAEGQWVIRLVATDENRVTSAIVPVTAKGADRASAKHFMRAPEENELTALIPTT